MLRSGYSSEAVLRELSTRHFADVFEPTIEKQLVQAGANQSLIDALRSGTYQLSDSEITATREKLAAQEERASLAGGGLEFRSAPGKGTEVHAWFPIRWHSPGAAKSC